jgi:hypothetical protein
MTLRMTNSAMDVLIFVCMCKLTGEICFLNSSDTTGVFSGNSITVTRIQSVKAGHTHSIKSGHEHITEFLGFVSCMSKNVNVLHPKWTALGYRTHYLRFVMRSWP